MTTRPVHSLDVFTHAAHTAQEWLDTVARQLAVEDTHHAYRIVRAWLHTVRDRLSVDVAVHFAAQLPLVWRGVFYDGWLPRQVPVTHDADQFLEAVAHDAGITPSEARQAVAAVTTALSELTSSEQVAHVLAQLPATLRDVLEPDTGRHHPAAPESSPAPRPRTPTTTVSAEVPLGTRVERLEQGLQTVTDAMTALVQALDVPPSSDPQPERFSTAARQAHQILLARPSAGAAGTT